MTATPVGRPLAYSISAAAEKANIGRDGLYRAIRDGRLRARKFGRRTVVLDSDLQAFLNDLPQLDLAKEG